MDLRVTNQLKFRFGPYEASDRIDWQEAGSFSAKDAPRIQRINAEHSFGGMLSYAGRQKESLALSTRAISPRISGKVTVWDYNYFYFEDGSLDSNVDLTMLLSGRWLPPNRLSYVRRIKRARPVPKSRVDRATGRVSGTTMRSSSARATS